MTMPEGAVQDKAGAGPPSAGMDDGPPLIGYLNLSDEHARELAAGAVPATVAAAQGVYTARTTAELPAWSRWIATQGDALPALVFPMVQPDGSATGQVKPAPGSVVDRDGRALKYVSPGADHDPPKLSVLREAAAAGVLLIVEGVKQALAALAWAPADWSIYRITGIWAWRVAGDGEDEPGTPTPHLSVVQGRRVVIVPDADARTNIRVFDGAVALGEACNGYGAAAVGFVRLPGAGKDGLDDVLGRLSDDSARRDLLSMWVRGSKPRPADLDKREQGAMRSAIATDNRVSEAEAALARTVGDRVSVDVSGDPRQASHQLLAALVEHRGGSTIFQFDSRMVRLRRGSEGSLRTDDLGFDGLQRELLDVACPVVPGIGFDSKPRPPRPAAVPPVLLGVISDHSDELPLLLGITRSPVVRADGTINSSAGYDAATKLYLDLTPDVQGIEVPEHPTDGDVTDARTLIRDDLFAMDGAGGFDGWVFKDVADQTNAVAGLLTPLVRPQLGSVPLCVFDGIQPGVGKGGALDLIHRVAFGTAAPVQTAPKSDEEMDKRVIAQLHEGAASVCLDEVQDKVGNSRLDSASLRTALTSTTYRGRELSKTRMLNLPNMASWYALGNNVQIPADMARRVYPVRLDSDRPDLENRDGFRHDLASWVPEHRAELLRACLVLVRSWYDRGQPAAPRSFGFASFSEWQRVLGGILHHAGFQDFLANVMEVREVADSEAVDNRECWEWLESKFGAGVRFGASEVIAQAKGDPDAPPPYGKSWNELDARTLSMYFGSHRQWYGNLRVRQDGKLHAGGRAFVVDRLPVGAAARTPAAPPSPTAPAGPPAGSRSAAGAARGEVVVSTDRRGFAQQVARAMPPMDGRTIAELGGVP